MEYHGRDWVNSARKLNKELFNKYLRKDFPDNSTTKEMIIRVINVCNNWSFKHGLIKKPIKKKRGASERQGTESSVILNLKFSLMK